MIGATVLAACSWANPGLNPYLGSQAAAVHTYRDIPADVRGRLADQVRRREYDDLVDIRRDSIEGLRSYGALRSMHFAGGRLCTAVDRSRWPAHKIEKGLVFCEVEHCILLPHVCGNVSRVTRLAPRPSRPAPRPAEPEKTNQVSEPGTLALVAIGLFLVRLMKRKAAA